jgi:hypothetical protein
MPLSLPLVTFDSEQLELWRRVNELWELAARKDDHGIRDALHPAYVGWDMSAPLPHDRDAAVRSASSDSPRLTRYALEPLSVRVYEGNVGVVHYRYEATVESQQGEPIRVAGKWTEVYTKKEQRWLMVAVSGQPTRTEALDGGAAPAA